MEAILCLFLRALALTLTVTAMACCCSANSNSNSDRMSDHTSNVVQMNQEIEADIFKEYGNIKKNGKVSFAFAKYFQNHMVLQQAPTKANIYGFSPFIGQKVIAMVTTATRKYYYTTVVEEGSIHGVGKWFFTLDPILTDSPASIYVASDAGVLTLDDVLFGDVWICSGQSNMEFTLSQMTNGSEEIANAHNYPDIRIMDVARRISTTPLDDLVVLGESWSVPSNSTVRYFSAVCWLYGKAIHMRQGYPIGLIASDWGGTPVETWSSPDALAKCGMNTNSKAARFEGVKKSEFAAFHNTNQGLVYGNPQNNSLLWNSMIHPFLGLTFYGVLWYQGEADTPVQRMIHYNCTFPAMIEDWRDKFHRASKGQTHSDFPFGFMQIGPNNEWPPASYGYPDVRWHQTANVGYVPNSKMPNTFMGVSMDFTDFKSPSGGVHYRDKEDATFRLSLAGLAVAYGFDDFFQGPFPVQASMSSISQLLIDYGPRWTLVVKNVFGFEVLCTLPNGDEDLWLQAKIVDHTNTSITLDLEECGPNPHALRYAWLISPCPFKACAIYSTRNDLPAPLFIVYATKDDMNSTVFNFS